MVNAMVYTVRNSSFKYLHEGNTKHSYRPQEFGIEIILFDYNMQAWLSGNYFDLTLNLISEKLIII